MGNRASHKRLAPFLLPENGRAGRTPQGLFPALFLAYAPPPRKRRATGLTGNSRWAYPRLGKRALRRSRLAAIHHRTGGGLVQHDYSEIERSLAAFVPAGAVFEVRLLHGQRKRVDAGYFDSPSAAATAIAGLEDHYQGIYFTPNPVVPALLARSHNRISAWAQNTTLDPDIMERRWILVDVDPDRPSGIGSTEAEMADAFKVARRIANMLELEGWPTPYINASGNGAHLMYAFNEPNNEFVRDEIHTFLQGLNGRFKGDGCSVDTTVFNAARIFRIPGTWARKGDNVADRPHRKAHQVLEPQEAIPVTLAQLCQYNQRNFKYVVKTAKTATGSKTYPADEKKYKGLNEQAMNRLKEWVPVLFPAARDYKQGYRVASDDLGQAYEEELAIHPWPLGIKNFGVSDQGDATEGRRWPVGLVAEFLYDGDKDAAARKLADVLNAPISEFDDILPAQGANGHASLPGILSPAPLFDFSRVPNMAQLQKRTFKELKWVIPGVLPTGNFMLAARPKMRKTFLALQLAIAVVGGRKFLQWQCEKGDVLFLGLEDNERRLRERIKLLQTFDITPPDLSGFRYWTGGVDISPTTGKEYVANPEEAARAYAAFPRGHEGIEALKRFLDMYPNTRLIIIDTYAHFREQSNNRDVYQRDVDQMIPITMLAAEREVCVVVVHHEKKGLANSDSADFMEDVSGTSGITGTVDGVISIKGKRGVQYENEARKLLISGRDVPRDFEVDMSFDAERGGWINAVRQDVKESILALLARHPFINQQEFASLLPSISRSRISQVLTELKYEGHITQNRYGYAIPRELGVH